MFGGTLPGTSELHDPNHEEVGGLWDSQTPWNDYPRIFGDMEK